MKRPDPRGPFRTVAEVTATPAAYVVRYEECGHIGNLNRTMPVHVGESVRCFRCRGEATAVGA